MSDVIDFDLLEKELAGALEEDRLYWLRNDAKIRAVTTQKVSTYEEFRSSYQYSSWRPSITNNKLTPPLYAFGDICKI